MKTINLSIFLFAITMGMSGCDDESGRPFDEVDGDDDRATGTVIVSGPWGCRDCGFSNSPLLGIHDLGSFRTGNTPGDGLLLVGIEEPNGTVRTVEVIGDAFVAKKNNQSYSGSQLVGWKLRFETAAKTIVKGRVYSYQLHPDWVKGEPVDTYSIAYEDVSGDFDVNICPGLNLDETSAVLIPGETYDLDSNTVEPGQSGFVTVACRGHSLAKMKLMGYSPGDAYSSKWEQRQATLKMLTADYCGKGVSFTQVGQPLDWRDESENFPFLGNENPARIEAKWDLDGATCLDTPRFVSRNEVEAVCKLPKCDDMDFDGADWISFRP